MPAGLFSQKGPNIFNRIPNTSLVGINVTRNIFSVFSLRELFHAENRLNRARNVATSLQREFQGIHYSTPVTSLWCLYC